MLKIRRPLGRLIFNMGIAIPGKTVFLIETAPRTSSKCWLASHNSTYSTVCLTANSDKYVRSKATTNKHLTGIQMIISWWSHQIETFSTLLAICAGNLPVPGEFPAQRPVTRGFDVFFDLCLNKRLSKQLWGWWFEMPSHPLWRHCNLQTELVVGWLAKCV